MASANVDGVGTSNPERQNACRRLLWAIYSAKPFAHRFRNNREQKQPDRLGSLWV